ncbi:conserved phage C-terminal domain-containing protein [Streptococcus sp. Marseille-P7376]|uniref:conserved phage C-terminal domain-containing protein n=1 Tax=Streptococcus sp. Marseille-P7376 TaxID=2592044 RepID=UPI0011E68D79|nr:conserved phage C-terminal domain-containing protein [Streptococcus sp. Marseille-P7376]
MAETYFKNEVEKYQYFQLPKWLFKEPYKQLSNNAKIMYALLYNRLNLSLESEWHDRNGQVFIYFTTSQFCEELGCSEKTVTKIKKELVTAGLLKEERQGLTKPNRLYILGPTVIKAESPDPQKLPSRTVENTAQEAQKVQTIKTDIIKTDIDNNKLSIFKEILDYLNEKTGKNFKATTKAHRKFITARLNEGYKLEDFKYVVDVMYAKWKFTKYEQYLQPQTLFGNKMDNYLNQSMPRKGQLFQSAVDERLGF